MKRGDSITLVSAGFQFILAQFPASYTYLHKIVGLIITETRELIKMETVVKHGTVDFYYTARKKCLLAALLIFIISFTQNNLEAFL